MVDVEAAVRQWLAGQLSCRVCTELPAAPPWPVVRVERSGGGNIGAVPQSLDSPGVQVYSFAYNAADGTTARDAARKLGEQVRDVMLKQLPGQVIGGGLFVSRVTCPMGPRSLPYTDDKVRMFTASYVLYCQAA